ncbi:error-prone DNA polymerase [Lysobacter sp. GX 14042]|uniref:error-prone DNA polymerase n=1 Tax=Lysobacter sp. GX 14042 TaxID=2907155 RepID=UPI001F39EB85|nr:error-prone DNA polymerase [Lysobacter sp. GX 14042]MCE7031577.1 error-prone DNA polymerase [Lysobacter sp. GX 14042]
MAPSSRHPRESSRHPRERGDPRTSTDGSGGSGAYAELHCLSAFSFQRGASVADELFERAARLGYTALAITDECSLAGIVRALEASERHGVKLVTGSEMQLEDGPKLVLLVEDAAGYTALCRLVTRARRRAPKGTYRLLREDFTDTTGLLALWVPGADIDDDHARWVQATFPDRAWLAVELHRGPDDGTRLLQLREAGGRLGLPLVAAGDVHMHVRGRRALQDTMTAIRHHVTVAGAGHRLFPNGERHLRSRRALSAIYPDDLLAETTRIAGRCHFSLRDDLKYQYPHELVPAGHDATGWLRHLVEEGARWRWPEGTSDKARELIEKELALVARLGYESYFLTVHDIVRFARSRGILCQGRGSAANSVICYTLGVTEIDPALMGMLFERFISAERNEPPDIDIDFEHERREEVLQYVFERYGRERAALTAVAIQYRGRGAVRDVGRALGLPPDVVGELASTLGRWSGRAPVAEHLRERGFDPDSPVLRQLVVLTAELVGMPRHLSQHPGGFVISEHPLSTLVPVENAAMDGRTVIQWDKDDLDTIGLMKVDCLALGMLTAVRKTLDLLRDTGRRDLALATIPTEDKPTYDMISRADTIGVFQIESRAQMAMLPRMRPRKFYDLVIQVAIVRPGPIQGDMVHPYLRRRRKQEAVDYPSEKLRKVLERTLGVPLFQEQVMQIAIEAAGYTGGEADQLRRSMAAWKRRGGLEPHRQKLTDGMLERGYTREYAERIFEQIKGFGDYGFPESHAASFALLAYASSWLKCHEPAAFACGLINSWPMGFYSPDQILQDARRHGIPVLPVDVRYSGWDCGLEPSSFPPPSGQPAIRLGLRMIRGFPAAAAGRIEAARGQRPFTGVADLCARAGLDRRGQSLLADAGALRGLAGHRHRARWAITGVEPQLPLFAGTTPGEDGDAITLPLPSAGEDLQADYAMLGTTLGRHPLAMLRKALGARRCRRSSDLAGVPGGRNVRVAGLVTLRQRPQTASGVIFMTLEDEAGMTNVVVWHDLAERQRRELLESRLLAVEGRLERKDGVQHLVARRLEDLTPLLDGLDVRSRDFH